MVNSGLPILRSLQILEGQLKPGKHTIVFDFKYDGLGMGTLAFNSMSGIGRSGTGVRKLMLPSGRRLTRKSVSRMLRSSCG